jgi:hypothetical protein
MKKKELSFHSDSMCELEFWVALLHKYFEHQPHGNQNLLTISLQNIHKMIHKLEIE